MDPGFGSAHYNLGICSLEMKDYSRAVSELRIAVRAFPDNAEIYEKLGDAFQGQAKSEEAMAYYQESIQTDPLNTSARAKVADIYMDRGEEDKAVDQYKAASDLNLQDISSHYKLAEHYKGIRDWKNARREYLLILAVRRPAKPGPQGSGAALRKGRGAGTGAFSLA